MRNPDSDWALGNLKRLACLCQECLATLRLAPLPLIKMVAVPDLKASFGIGESIFIVGKLVTWKTSKSENESDFLRVLFAHAESQPVAEKNSSGDFSALLESAYEKGNDSFPRSFAQLPFLSLFFLLLS